MNSEAFEALRMTTTCCIIGCETARAAIRSAHSLCGLSNELKKSVTCFNTCTVCAAGCCFMNNPIAGFVGCGCSAFGLCVDVGLYDNTERSHSLRRCHGSFHSTGDLNRSNEE